jgi:amidohydrolase
MEETRALVEQLLTKDFLEEIRGIRRHLHRHPELSFREFETSATIRSLLEEWGIAYEHPFVETGILAVIRGETPGGRIALRADMDALPIRENSGMAFSSENDGVMHACGHDVHMSALLGCIRILHRLRAHISGEILFVFQPGEEKLPGGASLMLEEGIFRNREPDMILAQHVLPDMDTGHVGFREGMYMASSDELYLTVKGKGGHGALRHLVKDPILMASRILLALQEEVQRRCPEGIPTVLSFGKVIADGATNVIPDEVYLEGTFRTMNEAWRKEAHGIIRELSNNLAGQWGGSCDVRILKGYPALHNNEQLTQLAREMATELLGGDRVEDMDIRMTAEDFAWFTQAIPGIMYRLGVKAPGSKRVYPLHTPTFRVDESALKTGIYLLSCLSIELLKKYSGE